MDEVGAEPIGVRFRGNTTEGKVAIRSWLEVVCCSPVQRKGKKKRKRKRKRKRRCCTLGIE